MIQLFILRFHNDIRTPRNKNVDFLNLKIIFSWAFQTAPEGRTKKLLCKASTPETILQGKKYLKKTISEFGIL